MIFESDPIEEADRDARFVNESNFMKKRKINLSQETREEWDTQEWDAIHDERYGHSAMQDKEYSKNLINGEFDSGVVKY
jgi:hypothetical protein